MADDGPHRVLCRDPRIPPAPDHRPHIRGQMGADSRIHSGLLNYSYVCNWQNKGVKYCFFFLKENSFFLILQFLKLLHSFHTQTNMILN